MEEAKSFQTAISSRIARQCHNDLKIMLFISTYTLMYYYTPNIYQLIPSVQHNEKLWLFERWHGLQ